MKRLPTLAIVSALVLSLAAPSGVVFAMSGEEGFEAQVVEVEGAESIEVVDPEISVESVVLEATVEKPATQDIQQDKGVVGGAIRAKSAEKAEAVDLLTPEATGAESADVVIAQIQVGVASADADPEITSNSHNEYVSIYNNSAETVDVTGWCLMNNKSKQFACLNELDVDYELEPRAYIGFSSLSQRPGHDSFMVRMTPSNNIVAGGDAISLIDGDRVIDKIEWASKPSDSYAIERQWSNSQVGVLKSGNASWGWKSKLTSHGYIEEMIECYDGMLVSSESGCSAVPVECRNMPGLLVSKLSSNFEVDDEGNCFENQCQNLAGFYSEVPVGFLGHENKQCFLDILPISVTELLPNPKGVDGGNEFIELYNPNKQPVDLKWWEFYLNDNFDKSFSFPEGSVIEAEEYAVFKNSDIDFSLTNNSGSFRLSSLDGQFAVDVPSWSNARDDKSWSLSNDEWMYLSPSPGVENKLPEVDIVPAAVLGLADCGEGRERNPATGRCRNVLVVRDLAPCREGQYRSEETNRCRSIVSTVASALKPCADDQFRNPETNRCRKIASSEDLTDCGEGRERNPETNRCRNVQTASMPLAPFATEPTIQQVQQDMLGWWMFGGVSLIAVGYAGWQWRFEAGRLMQQVRGKLSFGSKQ